MQSKQLSKDDIETVGLELKNSINGRQRRIWTATLTSIGGLVFAVTFYYLNFGRFSVALTLVSFLAMIYGIFNVVSWMIFSKSIERLKNDFDSGVKQVGQFRILTYNNYTKKVTLDNELKIDSFEIHDDWKTGDHVYIEKLPTSNFILRCDKNAR